MARSPGTLMEGICVQPSMGPRGLNISLSCLLGKHGRTGDRDYHRGSRAGAEEMRITFIGQASLLIEANRLNIVSDPWWNGPCFGAQWWPYPMPHGLYGGRPEHPSRCPDGAAR